MTAATPLQIPTPRGPVSGLSLRPANATLLYVLAHGAGAGMRHVFLETIAQRLATLGVATLRYQFPYMEAGQNRTDPPAVAEATVRAAVDAARAHASGLPIIAGGKSFGGRMTSQAQAQAALPGVVGLAFLGFPLHAPGRASDMRADHLQRITIPMLFLQGTRDPLAELTLVHGVVERLGSRATLHVVETGDHSFKVLKRSGKDDGQVLNELGEVIAKWAFELAV